MKKNNQSNLKDKPKNQGSIYSFLGLKDPNDTKGNLQNVKTLPPKRTYTEFKKKNKNNEDDSMVKMESIPASSYRKKKVIDDDDSDNFNEKPTPRFIDVKEKAKGQQNVPIKNDILDQIEESENEEEIKKESLNKNNNPIFDLSEFDAANLESQLQKDPTFLDSGLYKNFNSRKGGEGDHFEKLKKGLENKDKKTSFKQEKSNDLDDNSEEDLEDNYTTNRKKKSSRSTSRNRTGGKNKRKRSTSAARSSFSDLENRSEMTNEEGLEKKELFQNPQNGLPDFLQPENVLDKNQKSPSDPDYDPTTLFIPQSFLSSQTASMKQFWEFKRDNFDKVIFFKLGKFYELFFDDAIIGNQILDLNWMGNDPKKLHVGFPERVLEEKAAKLVEEGYIVAVVEQMETPEQMKARNAAGTGKKDKLIKREICNVFTKGTYLNMDQQGLKSNNGFSIKNAQGKNKFCVTVVFSSKIKNNNSDSFNFANQGISQLSSNSNGILSIEWGITIFDVTTLNFHVGKIVEEYEIKDNSSNLLNDSLNNGPKHEENYTKLKTMLYNISPDEIIVIRNNIPNSVINFMESLSSRPKIILLRNDYSVGNLSDLCKKYFGEDFEKWNPAILNPISDETNNKSTCLSIYLTMIYLEKILIADECLASAEFKCYNNETDVSSINPNKKLILDYQAISNLEIIETKLDPKNPQSGSLVEFLNQAITPFGKRMMRNWILNPLSEINTIKERFDMIEDFMNNEEMLAAFRNSIGKFPDFQRSCSKFFKFAMSKANNNRAVYFEDVGKNRLKDFFHLIQLLSSSIEVFEIFQKFIKENKLKSQLLIEKTTLYNFDENDENLNDPNNYNGNLVPNIAVILSSLHDNFTLKTNKDKNETYVEPKEGICPEYDACKENIAEIENNLKEILNQEKKRLKCVCLTYVHTKGNRYELEVPESAIKDGRPSDYMLTTSRKGYKRFHTEEILDQVKLLEQAEENLKKQTQIINTELFKDFYKNQKFISIYLNTIGELDCLSTLAYISLSNKSTFTKPEFISLSDNNNQPYIELRDSVHPCLLSRVEYFVPNDVIIGENQKNLIVMTGPNMGGKSTLLRQVCVSVIMAQIGCYVPAQKCILTPVDRIFTRIGASDSILEGKSTFYVEMEETKNIIQNATINSLVIMDELGRGTSTHDGKIIAKTILQRIESSIKCRTLFTTHYHDIINWCEKQTGIELYFMDSNVNEETKDIKFLYKFKKGICPKSYGISVAKLAGLPDSIIKMASEVSEMNRKKNKVK